MFIGYRKHLSIGVEVTHEDLKAITGLVGSARSFGALPAAAKGGFLPAAKSSFSSAAAGGLLALLKK